MLKKADFVDGMKKPPPKKCPLITNSWVQMLPAGKASIIEIAGQKHQQNPIAQGVAEVPCNGKACAWWDETGGPDNSGQCVIFSILGALETMAYDEEDEDEGGWGKEKEPEGGDGNGGEGRILEVPVHQGVESGGPSAGEGGSPAGV